MSFDIRTLMVSNTLIVSFLFAALIFYKFNRRTYPGFGFWAAGSCSLALGYIAMILRGRGLSVDISIILVNAAFALAALLRLEGTVRFMENRQLAKAYYAIPVFVSIVCYYFYAFDNLIIIRNLTVSAAASAITLIIAWKLVRHAPSGDVSLYRITAALYILFILVVMGRSALWLVHSDAGLFDADMFNSFYFLTITAFEIGWALSYLMMNSQRLEGELREAQKSLGLTVAELEIAISEIKTLGGMLPICSTCKRIRDDKGYWNQLEDYLHEHTEADFSHSICPECSKRLYPEFFDEENLSS
jgi:hypothetical protein